jgi:hypothetical protein
VLTLVEAWVLWTPSLPPAQEASLPWQNANSAAKLVAFISGHGASPGFTASGIDR